MIQPTKVDPMNINIVANCDALSESSPSQDFYTHFSCLKERLQQNVSGYFLESNFVIDDGPND